MGTRARVLGRVPRDRILCVCHEAGAGPCRLHVAHSTYSAGKPARCESVALCLPFQTRRLTDQQSSVQRRERVPGTSPHWSPGEVWSARPNGGEGDS